MSSLAGTGRHPSAGMAPDKLGLRGPFIRGTAPFIRGAGDMEFCPGDRPPVWDLSSFCSWFGVFSFHFEQGLQQWDYGISALPGTFFQGMDPSATSPSFILLFSPHPRRRVSILTHQGGLRSFHKDVEFFLASIFFSNFL